MGMEWVLGQVADHHKQTQLFFVQDSFSWQTASQKEHKGAWCLVMEPLKVHDSSLVVVVNN